MIPKHYMSFGYQVLMNQSTSYMVLINTTCFNLILAIQFGKFKTYVHFDKSTSSYSINKLCDLLLEKYLLYTIDIKHHHQIMRSHYVNQIVVYSK
jgi:hypothetical protein